jgi:prevent-host-death family protein
MRWKLQDLKARFSELVQRALDEGPQTVSRRGKDVVVVISAEQLELMRKRQISLKDLLRSAPWHDLEIERDKSPPREIDL